MDWAFRHIFAAVPEVVYVLPCLGRVKSELVQPKAKNGAVFVVLQFILHWQTAPG